MSVTVHYFDIYGRAEPLRMILHYHGTPFNDHRIQQQEWPALKASGFSEFGGLPVVEIDGRRLGQTPAISRYMCNKFGYGTSDPDETYMIESLCDMCDDIFNSIAKLAMSQEFEALNKLFQDKVPDWLRIMENRLLQNNQGRGYFVGSHPTRADFHVFAICHDSIGLQHPELIEQYAPNVKRWMDRFGESSRSFKEYLRGRPSRPF